MVWYRFPLHSSRSKEPHHWLVSVLDQLIDQIGEDKSHPLASLMEGIGTLIECYEDEHVPELDE